MLHVLLQVDNLVEELILVGSLGVSVLERSFSLSHDRALEELDRLDDVHSVFRLDLGAERLPGQGIKLLKGQLIVKVEAITEGKAFKSERRLADEHAR